MNKPLRFLLEALALVALIAACCYGAGLALRAPDAYAARLQTPTQVVPQPLPQLTSDLDLPREMIPGGQLNLGRNEELTAQADAVDVGEGDLEVEARRAGIERR